MPPNVIECEIHPTSCRLVSFPIVCIFIVVIYSLLSHQQYMNIKQEVKSLPSVHVTNTNNNDTNDFLTWDHGTCHPKSYCGEVNILDIPDLVDRFPTHLLKNSFICGS